MTRIIWIFALALLVMTGGCAKNEFKVEISLPADIHDSYRLVYYASAKNGGRVMETIAVPTEGKCEVTGITRYPTVVYIYRGYAETPSAIFYAERGDDIKISGESSDPVGWKISGNDLNEEWSAWRTANATAINEGSAKPEGVNDAVAKYVRGHKDSPLSAMLLLTSYYRSADESGFRELWKSLGKDADADEMASLVARADQPGVDLLPASRLKALPVMLRNDSADTIRLGKAKAAIIYFWHSDNNARHQIIDSLKTLTRDYPDSASRLIADISLAPDSTEWIMTMRFDSLRHTRRAWIFRGEADDNVRALGVAGTPWLIVTDAKGDRKYSGPDISAAMSRFRSIMKKAPKSASSADSVRSKASAPKQNKN